MAPIPLALIGLSQSAKTSWAGYTIVALLNSTKEAARRAIDHYKLSNDTRAYGSPQDLAADNEVDLVVCTTRVDVHYGTILPSIQAGKDIFVEWPLAENAKRAGELAGLARRTGSKTIIGLQGRVAPAVVKIREILETEKLRKVLSSSVQAYTPGSQRDSISEGLAYFLDKNVGGNPITIAFGHMIEYVHFGLDEFEDSHSHTQVQHPSRTIINHDTGERRSHTSDVPDLLSVHGTLRRSSLVENGASLTVTFRSGSPLPGTVPFVWTINCENGVIQISSERGPFLQSEAGALPVPIRVHYHATDEVHQVGWAWEDWQKELTGRGRSIAKVYDLFSEGRLEEEFGGTFDSAVERHKQIDAILYAGE